MAQPNLVRFQQQFDSLIGQSRQMTAERQFDLAWQMHQEAEQLVLQQLGPRSFQYGVIYFNRARIHDYRGDPAKARESYIQAKDLFEEIGADQSAEYASTVSNLAILYKDMGEWGLAESYFLKALSLRRHLFGKESPEYSASLNNLSNYYVQNGLYEQALPYLTELESIVGHLYGLAHPGHQKVLRKLANLYYYLGRYGEAEQSYLKLQRIQEGSAISDTLGFAQNFNDLGSLCRTMGRFTQAEQAYLRSLDLLTDGQFTGSRDHAMILNNLGNLYLQQYQYEKAGTRYRDALQILEKIALPDDPDRVLTLRNLAVLQAETGNLQQAIEWQEQCRAATGKRLGIGHPEYATCLDNLAVFYTGKQELEMAKALHQEAESIRKVTLGVRHPQYAWSLEYLAGIYLLQQQQDSARILYSDAVRSARFRILSLLPFVSEPELYDYLQSFKSLQSGIGLAGSMNPADTAMAAICYDYQLFFKGFVMQAYLSQQKALAVHPEAKPLQDRWKGYCRLLMMEYGKPVADRLGIQELEDSVNLLQKQVAHSLFIPSELMEVPNWRLVQDRLQAGESALEFFNYTDPRKKEEVHYAAVLLLPAPNPPRFVHLCLESEIKSLLEKPMAGGSYQVNDLYALADRGSIPLETSQPALYDLIWRPLIPFLEGIQTIYASPAGMLHRLNLGAIPIDRRYAFADRYELVLLGSTRQLILAPPVAEGKPQAVLYGGIDYDEGAPKAAEIPAFAFRSPNEISFQQTDPNLRTGTWGYLPGTEKEVQTLAGIFHQVDIPCQVIRGVQATEESLKQLGSGPNPSPAVLHLATHGYFFPEPLVQQSLIRPGTVIFQVSDHPMLRSGLILAGANPAWAGKARDTLREDGVLTAYEIAQLDLSKTTLVVLSACETGLGDIRGNEGVYGLQRAFKMAGVQYLLMSLWKIPDKPTALLMTTFYQKWLQEHLSIPRAFQAAQQALRDLGMEPYQWAGFILVQ